MSIRFAQAPRTHSDEAFDLLSSLLAESASGFETRPGEKAFVDNLTSADRLWEHLPDEAFYHGVVVLVLPALTRLAHISAKPEASGARRKLTAIAARQKSAVRVRERCVSDLIGACQDRGVGIVLLKGAALAHLLYEFPEDRPSLDIDVLVGKKDLQAARAAAEELGYTFSEDHESKFTPRMNHLPEASLQQEGFRIALEIHVDALSPTRRKTLTMDRLSVPLQLVGRGSHPAGTALGHYDMLRHLAHHTFEPSQRIRLIHLFDLWRYDAMAGNAIATGGPDLRHIRAAISMARLVFEKADGPNSEARASGVGDGMLPLSGVTREGSFSDRLGRLLLPSEWWLRGFYGVPPESMLAPTRFVRHPLTLARWIASRYLARMLRTAAPGRIRLRA